MNDRTCFNSGYIEESSNVLIGSRRQIMNKDIKLRKNVSADCVVIHFMSYYKTRSNNGCIGFCVYPRDCLKDDAAKNT